jgi:hypothetical protein
LVDDHALEDTATCQRLLLLLLPEGKASIELAESLAKDFNCSYAMHLTLGFANPSPFVPSRWLLTRGLTLTITLNLGLDRYDIRSVASTSEGRLVKWRERVAGMCKLVMKSLLGSGGRLRNVHKTHAWMEQLHTMVRATERTLSNRQRSVNIRGYSALRRSTDPTALSC